MNPPKISTHTVIFSMQCRSMDRQTAETGQPEWQHSGKECMCPLRNVAHYVTAKKVWLPGRQTPDKVIRMCRYASQAIQLEWGCPNGTKYPRGNQFKLSYAPETFFSNPCIVTLTFDLLTPKSIGSILDSWGDCMWSFMKIGVKGKQLCARNHFQ